MRRWLQGETTPLTDSAAIAEKLPLETAEDLACLDQLPTDAINYKIHHEFTRLAEEKKWTRRSGAARRAEIVRGLQEKVFRWFPQDPIPFASDVSRNSGGWASRYAAYKEVTFQTEPGVRVRAQLLTPTNRTAATPLLLFVKRAGDSIYAMDFDELLPILGRHTVLILNPRFTETAISAAEYRNVEMTAAWSGRTIAALQIWDILRAAEWILSEERIAPSTISIYGQGEMGILGLYAAILDSRVSEVILKQPPSSHWQGPALLNILRVTDIPEMAGALAPRRLVSLTKLSEDFDLTRNIYRMQRASAQFEIVDSLPEAVRIFQARPRSE